MQISIIIVSYNVKYFLEQCLCSVRKAAAGMETEIFVADNASSDGTIAYLQARFPEVGFIQNQQNLGFGKANNQALALATGKWILFLNPDTILSEETLKVCIRFLEGHPDAGACGVRMIDGSGRFLPESKRGLPTLPTSLYKFTGLASLFPRSERFARYYLGHLAEDRNHAVDVLAGAFFMAGKTVLDQTGGFDEAFFMYGEDIDLSYRIRQAGYRNYYLADTTILHFKGESTQKQSPGTIRHFYGAMEIFARKHYSGRKAAVISAFVRLAIRLKTVSQKKRPDKQALLPPDNSLPGTLIAGDPASREEAVRILKRQDQDAYSFLTAGAGDDLLQAHALQPVQQIVFCEGLLSFAAIIAWMQALPASMRFRVHAGGSSSIAGSDRKTTKGTAVS